VAKTGKVAAQAAGETKLDRYRRRIAGIRNERSSWEGHWRDIQHYISPRSGRFFLGSTNIGVKKSQRIINNAPTQASKTLAAGMMSGLTSPSRPWFRLMTPDPAMMEIGSVKLWLFAVESRMRDVLARSNLYQCLPNLYRELGDYGTAAMMCEADDAFVCRFTPLTIGSYWLATNDQREVDTLYREIEMTVRQVVQKFGYDACSPNVRSQYDSQHFENRIVIEHMIQPNGEREHGRVDARTSRGQAATGSAGRPCSCASLATTRSRSSARAGTCSATTSMVRAPAWMRWAMPRCCRCARSSSRSRSTSTSTRRWWAAPTFATVA